MTAMSVLPADLLHTDAYRRDPTPAWRRLRHEAPIWYDAVADRWIVSRYDDVLGVLRDAPTYGVERPYRRFSEQIGPTLVNLDGPAHRRRRAIVAPELVGRRLDAIRPRIAGRVADLFAGWPTAGSTAAADAHALVASRLPALVIGDLLGLDDADQPAFARHSEVILAGLGGDPEAAARGRAAHRALAALFEPRIAAAEQAPGDDLIAAIVRGESDGQRLTGEEVRSFISLLLVAGGETTALAITNAWTTLARSPEVQAWLAPGRPEQAPDPERLDALFSEALRRDGPVIAEDRAVNRDVEWYGVTVPAGATIRAFIGSANRDETVFAEPDRFDPERPDLRRGKESRAGGRDPDGRAGHLTFGAGDHFCLGYQLARAEFHAATSALVARWPRFVVAPPASPFEIRLELMRHVDGLRLMPA